MCDPSIVAGRAPTGLVLFAYSIPSILTRVLVPLLSLPDSPGFSKVIFLFARRRAGSDPGSTALAKEVNYPLRLVVCAVSSFIGLQLLARFDKIVILVLGIMLAALSSNLGDM